jgi:hypothetical protein
MNTASEAKFRTVDVQRQHPARERQLGLALDGRSVSIQPSNSRCWRGAASFPTHDPLVRLTSPSVGESAEAEVRLDSESARLSVRASRRHDESESAQPEESKCARRRLSPRQDHRDL